VQQVLHRQFAELAIPHELAEDFFVTFHAVYHQALKGFFKHIAEVVFRVRYGSLAQRVALYRLLLNLIKKQLVGLGEVRAKAVVQDVNELRQADG